MSLRVRCTATILCAAALAGCAMEYNPHPPRAEMGVLSNVAQLTRPAATDGFDRAGQGRFSPDGRWVVFRGAPRGAPAGAYGLFVARVVWAPGDAGRRVIGLERPIRITRLGARCGGACFSPDGFTLAFAAAGRSSQMQLFRVDGWEQDVAMADVARGVDLAQHAITAPGLAVAECDWSPDGRSICVAAAPPGGALGLYALRPDGTLCVRLGPADGYGRGPAFSPDGHRLLYRGGAGSPGSQIVIADIAFNVAGDPVGLADAKPLTHEEGVVSSGPCWLPDGHHIVYATTRHGDAELYVMDAEGQRKTRVTFSPGADLLPWASPDGGHLLWTSARAADGAPQLFAATLQLPEGS